MKELLQILQQLYKRKLRLYTSRMKETENKIQALTGLDLRTIRNGLKPFNPELSSYQKLQQLAMKTIAVNVAVENRHRFLNIDSLIQLKEIELKNEINYELLETHAIQRLEILKEKFKFYHLSQYDDICDIIMSVLDESSYDYQVWEQVKFLNND